MIHIVAGLGEVGASLHRVLTEHSDEKVGSIDIDYEDIEDIKRKKIDFLHVCFPWSDVFIKNVADYADKYQPTYIVVHSTVPIGTCEPNGWIHSPVRGMHPELDLSLKTFTKHFGGVNAEDAADSWDAMGIGKTKVHLSSSDTEAAKILELIQYGVNIQVEKSIHAFCVNNQLNFDVVYTQFAETYNEGFSDMNLGMYVRPILKHIPGDIKGHCVVPMSHLIDHPLAEIVQKGVDQ